MPFTPFHFGPSFVVAFADIKKKRIDLTAALLGSVIVDIRALFIFFFGGGNFHGPLHTYLAAILLGIAIGLILHIKWVDSLIQKVLKFIKWEQSTNLLSKILSATIFAVLHIFLDSFLYTDIQPFQPFSAANPLLNLINSSTIYLFCVICFIVALGEYLYGIYWMRRRSLVINSS